MKIRHFAEACKSISRNKMMSFTSVIIVASCLFIVLLMYCVAVNIDAIIGGVESDIEVSAFIEDGLGDDSKNQLLIDISSMGHVEQVIYVSKDENWSSWGPTKDMDLENFEYNPLRDSFKITVDSAENIQGVVDTLRVMPGLVTVNHATDTVSTIMLINNVIRVACLVIIGILGVMSVIIITNTIKLTIDNRKTEIGIMKYIGSTNWFIRWPFVLEGMILGFFGAIIPLGLFMAFYDGFLSFVADEYLFFMTTVVFRTGGQIFPVLAPIVIVLGGLIGTLASISSIRKHLNV